MKTTINKDFFDFWGVEPVVMWCKTEEYAIEFCKILDKYGLQWCYGGSYIDDSNWKVYEQDTCYDFNFGEYCDLEFLEDSDYTILDFEDYIVKE